MSQGDNDNSHETESEATDASAPEASVPETSVPETSVPEMTSVPQSNLLQLIEKVIALLEPELTAGGYDLLDVRIFQGGGRFQVRIYVDLAEGGITLDGCTKAARTIGMLLEEADLFPGQYVIEASSPGIRRPLRKPAHYQAVVGEKVELKLHPGGPQVRVRGKLTGVEDSCLLVMPPKQAGSEEEPEVLRIELNQVAEGNLDPTFDAKAIINADRRRRKDERRAERQEKSRQKRKKARPKSGKKSAKKSDEKSDKKTD